MERFPICLHTCCSGTFILFYVLNLIVLQLKDRIAIYRGHLKTACNLNVPTAYSLRTITPEELNALADVRTNLFIFPIDPAVRFSSFCDHRLLIQPNWRHKGLNGMHPTSIQRLSRLLVSFSNQDPRSPCRWNFLINFPCSMVGGAWLRQLLRSQQLGFVHFKSDMFC